MERTVTPAACPACLEYGLLPFYRREQVPVHTTLLMPTCKRALEYPRRDIELAFCRHCGFICNQLFEQGIHEYSPACEESQGCSPKFMSWLRALADRLIETYGIRNRTVLEIGCGKGEFLAEICARGENRGIGYDPAYVPGRLPDAAAARIDFRARMWDQACGTGEADFIACRHTLEHIPNVLEWVRDVRSAIRARTDTLVFFEVPDTARVLGEAAFWDVYYEHCSYFTRSSLCSLFARAGFDVLECWLDYGDQYLMLVARPAPVSTQRLSRAQPDLDESQVHDFNAACLTLKRRWSERLEHFARQGASVMLWGGGSKAAGFLNDLDQEGTVRRVIDINPQKHHCFIPGTGQEVVAPEILAREPADIIILMNPVYRGEVQRCLDDMGCEAELLSL